MQKAGKDTPCPSSVGEDARRKPKPFQRLDGPVLADGSRDTLDQLVTAGLRPVRLAF
jgi:hypothetical protein